jgi:hypothetical protein
MYTIFLSRVRFSVLNEMAETLSHLTSAKSPVLSLCGALHFMTRLFNQSCGCVETTPFKSVALYYTGKNRLGGELIMW